MLETRQCNESVAISFYLPIDLQSVEPLAHEWNEVNLPVHELDALLLGGKLKVGDPFIPLIEEQLKLCGRHVVIVVLEMFQLVEGSVADKELLVHVVVALGIALNVEAKCLPLGRDHLGMVYPQNGSCAEVVDLKPMVANSSSMRCNIRVCAHNARYYLKI